jgi:hypothetical protein
VLDMVKMGGRLQLGGGGGSVWWQQLNAIVEGVGLLDGGWLHNNIVRVVGDGSSTLFWKDHWIGGNTLLVRFHRLFDPSENKLASAADMFYLGRGSSGKPGNGGVGCWRGRRSC